LSIVTAFILLLAFIAFEFTGCAAKTLLNSEEVQTMREYEQEEKGKKEFLAQEDNNFQRIKEAIRSQSLKEGLLSSEITAQFGAPVLISPDGKNQRWLYKGKGGGWFKAPKIYLFLDENNHLQKWQCLRTDCAAQK